MADLMAGLMMVFMVVAVSFMRYVQVERDKIKEVAVAYQDTQVAIYQALDQEFSADLQRWDAEIDQNSLEFRFKSPEVLFDSGHFDLKPEFQSILSDFFPRYMQVLQPFREDITEVRIEGHTSSDWGGTADHIQAYFNNMALSQGRTREVLQYLFQLPAVAEDQVWMKRVFAAVGFSSAHPILDWQGQEDLARSRRVTFKVVSNAELQIQKIVGQ